jgi:DNA repair exonuclease SbcCD ATPase subunit
MIVQTEDDSIIASQKPALKKKGMVKRSRLACPVCGHELSKLRSIKLLEDTKNLNILTLPFSQKQKLALLRGDDDIINSFSFYIHPRPQDC